MNGIVISLSDNYFIQSPVFQALRNFTFLFFWTQGLRQIVSIIKIVNVIRCYCKDLTMAWLLSQHLHHRGYAYLGS